MITNLYSKRSGRAIANQFVYSDGTVDCFQSYQTKICEVNFSSKILKLTLNSLNFSQTTSKYLCQWLSELFETEIHRKDIERWIKNGQTEVFELGDYNLEMQFYVREVQL